MICWLVGWPVAPTARTTCVALVSSCDPTDVHGHCWWAQALVNAFSGEVAVAAAWIPLSLFRWPLPASSLPQPRDADTDVKSFLMACPDNQMLKMQRCWQMGRLAGT